MNSIGTQQKKAVIFGAGKMACGLLGQLLFHSDFHTLFVARRAEVINAINRWEGYTLETAGEGNRRLSIHNCAALSIRDEYRVIEAVVKADVVFTAVGIDNLSAVTPLIAEGLWIRSQIPNTPPLNIIACENLPGTGDYLRHQVLNAVLMKKTILIDHLGGFSAGLTRRVMTGGFIEDGRLIFSSDSEIGLIIDTRGLKGDFPDMQGITFTDEFPVMVMRKLFTINCIQTIAAYLGYREGCRYVHEAAVHPRVMPVLTRAMAEAMAALKAEYPHCSKEIEQEMANVLERISNASLSDTISRVAREPRRKLSPRERLVGPVILARRHDLPYENLCHGIAAAISYDDPTDAQAMIMQEQIKTYGIEKILTEDCGLLPYEPIALTVKQFWRDIAGTIGGNPLLSTENVIVDDIFQHLSLDFTTDHDPNLVKIVLTSVQKEFIDAQIHNYLPILIKKRAAELLKEMSK